MWAKIIWIYDNMFGLIRFHARTHNIQRMPSTGPTLRLAVPNRLQWTWPRIHGRDRWPGWSPGRPMKQPGGCGDLVGGWNPTHPFLKFDQSFPVVRDEHKTYINISQTKVLGPVRCGFRTKTVGDGGGSCWVLEAGKTKMEWVNETEVVIRCISG